MRTFIIALGLLALVLSVSGAGGCARSRADGIRDHAAIVEKKLETERDRVLGSGETPSTRQEHIDHLQTLRVGLSMVNISLASVPVLLRDESQREIGYSVLDEALGTIDWNIPIFQQSGAPSASGGLRPYPSLFSAQSGLDFAAIQSGARPGVEGPNNLARPPGIAR